MRFLPTLILSCAKCLSRMALAAISTLISIPIIPYFT